MIDNSKEYILCAAVKRKSPRPYAEQSYSTSDFNDIHNIEIGYRHHDIYVRFGYTLEDCPLDMSQEAQGFYTSQGRFVDRWKGMEIAYNAGQVDEYTALDKSWMDIPLNTVDENGNPIHKQLKDEHKFNMLMSEDLY